jgi:betaine-aldehyde dehydrogenase
VPASQSKGWYVEPTVLTNVTPDSEVWQHEIFGPVLSVMTFKTEVTCKYFAVDTLRYGYH